MNADVWGIFHDGVIERIDGSIPGLVVLHLNVPYLRQMFNGQGNGFKVSLSGCTKLEYTEYDDAPTSDLLEIGAKQPEVLYVTSTDPLVLDCAMGTLGLAYEAIEITLDSGEPVSYEELAAACEKYWDDWQRQTRA